MKRHFSYTSETDRSYGIAGMALMMNIWDKEDMLRSISLDGIDIEFAPEFFCSPNPNVSAKAVYAEMHSQYQILSGLVISNILCRYRVNRCVDLDAEELSTLHDYLCGEGSDICSLDTDESSSMFKKIYSYFGEVYSTSRVHYTARRIATELVSRRTLSGVEVDELVNR